MRRLIRWWRKRQLRNTYIKMQKLVKQIDASMILFGWSRARRKQIWYAFLKDENMRGNFFNEFLKELDKEEKS